MRIILDKCGTNPDQKPVAVIEGPGDVGNMDLRIGEELHVEGQPQDVRWKIRSITNL